MTWLRIEDTFMEHPKIAALPLAALKLHLVALCYCARHNTDGFVPQMTPQSAYISRPKVAAERLVKCGLWEPVEGGWMVHDFLHYNPTKAQVEHQKSLTRDRQHRYRSGAESDALRDASRDALVTPPRPVPFIKSPPVVLAGDVDNPEKMRDKGEEEEIPAALPDVLSAIDRGRALLRLHHPKIDPEELGT